MQHTNIYDIIIEEVITQRRNSMIANIQKWEVPQYSKKEINKAGSVLADKIHHSLIVIMH